ncbi:MAG: response regulator transcription factor [Pseudomonadota bacterium]
MATETSFSNREHVMVVDDDDLFRESLVENLKASGFNVSTHSNGPDALAELLNSDRHTLLLLDWRMPKMTGIQVLRKMRESQIAIPVIFLTALGDQMYEEAALAGGAVDFVEKSRSFSILLRRIGLILEGGKTKPASEATTDDVLQDGNLKLHLDTSRAFWKDKQVPLTLREFELIRYLATQPEKDVSYRELYNLVRDEDFYIGADSESYRSNIRNFIKRIRKKFRDIDQTFDHIENYPGFGYRWRHGKS